MPLDILSAFENDPPELQFVLPGLLRGTVGALVAPGASGKSFLALEIAASIAATQCNGEFFDGFGINPKSRGGVLYLALEDPESVIQRRLHAMGAHIPPAHRAELAFNLCIEPMLGAGLDLMRDDHLNWISQQATGKQLVVIDTLSRAHQLDENSNGDMSLLLRRLEAVGAQSGAAVLFIHHISKGASRDAQGADQFAARGASVLIENARYAAYLSRMTEKECEKWSDRMDGQALHSDMAQSYVKWGVSKQNYDVTPDEKWFKRSEGGVLLPAELTPARAPAKPASGVDDDNW
ncbi:MAG: AAA family ATPase [Methyloprofundus sp.]|nr:AAA family ATPase [Methyloprofundus sp.]MBE0470697.1 AAA family ATPase [Methyloprofundus sp.]MBE0470704.1 AAA family ATPase [Methyloprofundus sp.]